MSLPPERRTPVRGTPAPGAGRVSGDLRVVSTAADRRTTSAPRRVQGIGTIPPSGAIPRSGRVGGGRTLLIIGLTLLVLLVEAVSFLTQSNRDVIASILHSVAVIVGAALLVHLFFPNNPVRADRYDPAASGWRTFLLLCERAGIAVVARTNDPEHALWNGAASSMFGFTDQDLPPDRWPVSLVPEDRRAEWASYYHTALAGETVAAVETEIVNRAGRRRSVLLTVGPYRPVDGGPYGVAALYVDLATVQHAEESSVEVARRDAALATVRTFAHEVNQPLTLLMGLLELQRSRPPEDPNEIAQRLRLMEDASRSVADKVRRLEAIVRFKPRVSPGLPPMLDLERSSRPAGLSEG